MFARRFGRGVLWAVVALAAVTGVRAWVVPPEAPTPPAPKSKAAPTYPSAEAQAVAARFSRAYLAWNEDEPQERAALLAAVMPANTDTKIGWDGQGRQDVLAVQPGAVTPGREHQARVRVDVLVKPAGPVDKKDAQPSPAARWMGLDVPVVEAGERVIVTGEPGLVGIPTQGPEAPDLHTVKTDQDLSTSTEAAIEQFFRAYAGGDTGSVAAPGSTVPALPEGVEYKGLTAWAVDEGTGDDRTGTARVSWGLKDATIQQTYRVELTRVSSADAARWQVADVRGGSL